MKLGGKISISPRYVIEITGTDPLSLGELGGGGRLILNKLEKIGIFNLRRSDQILMKFEVWKDIVSQSSCFKFRLGSGDIGGN